MMLKVLCHTLLQPTSKYNNFYYYASKILHDVRYENWKGINNMDQHKANPC